MNMTLVVHIHLLGVNRNLGKIVCQHQNFLSVIKASDSDIICAQVHDSYSKSKTHCLDWKFFILCTTISSKCFFLAEGVWPSHHLFCAISLGVSDLRNLSSEIFPSERHNRHVVCVVS